MFFITNIIGCLDLRYFFFLARKLFKDNLILCINDMRLRLQKYLSPLLMSTRAPHEAVVACFIIAKFTKLLQADFARYTPCEPNTEVGDDLSSLYILSKDTFFS